MDRRDYDARLADLPRRRDQVLPALHAVHAVAGWLPEAAIEAVSLHTSVPLSELYGVVRSYSELRLAPPHEPHVELCAGLSCRIAGADALSRAADEAGVPVGRVPCRFLCAVAPVAEVAGRYHGRLTPAAFRALVDAATPEAAR
jgi:NADH:ubiquinone oxidoreductase subunit E